LIIALQPAWGVPIGSREIDPPVTGLDDVAKEYSDKNPALALHHKSQAYPLAHSPADNKIPYNCSKEFLGVPYHFRFEESSSIRSFGKKDNFYPDGTLCHF
jgi:hypothetical protein